MMACPQSLAKIKVRKWCFFFPPTKAAPWEYAQNEQQKQKIPRLRNPAFFKAMQQKRSTNAQTVIIPHVYSCCTPPNALIIRDVESDS